MAVPAQRPGRSPQHYATPGDFLAAVKKRLGISAFAFDFAADAINKVCPRYWSAEDDSLAQDRVWAEQLTLDHDSWGWLNPPFARIEPWAARCAGVKLSGRQIALLVPAAVGSNWFRDHVHGNAYVLLLNGRICFDPRNPTWGYPKDCVLALYSPAMPPGYDVWRWK